MIRLSVKDGSPRPSVRWLSGPAGFAMAVLWLACLFALAAVTGCSDSTATRSTPVTSPLASASASPSQTPPAQSPTPHAAFVRIGALPFMQAGHTATLLQDGRVLIAGGHDLAVPPSARGAVLYDPKTDSFVRTGSMAVDREFFNATLLPDGRVLMTGGLDSVAELYDTSTGTFSATGVATPRSDNTATALLDGRVLLAGGFWTDGELSSSEIYDPALGTFVSTGSMRVAREQHAAVLMADGRVLIAGGFHGGRDGFLGTPKVFDSAEVYDPSTGKFAPAGSMKVARSYATATLLRDGRILVAGGEGDDYSPLASAEIYDPADGTFTPTGSMTSPHSSAAATILQDGRVLIVGGYGDAGLQYGSEIYDPATGAFSAGPAMTDDGRAGESTTATLLSDGRVLVVEYDEAWICWP
jgi:hypothetical protein